MQAVGRGAVFISTHQAAGSKVKKIPARQGLN
jgi:hypothetical protein